MNKKQLLWAWLLALMLPATLSAQTWTASAPQDGGTYYLYNVGKRQYVDRGEDFATRISFSYGGVPITFTADGDNYYMKSPLGFLGTDGYLDKSDTSSKKVAWIFTAVDGQPGTYTISTGSKYLVGSTSYAYAPLADDLTGDELSYWKLEAQSEREDLSDASQLNPVDVTYLLINQGFTWYTGEQRGWFNADNNRWKSENGANVRGGEAYNPCAEVWNNTFNIHQTLTNVPNGLYKMTLQGFYRTGVEHNTAENAANARAEGNEQLNAKYYLTTSESNVEGTLASIFAEEKTVQDSKLAPEGWDINGTKYYVPTSMNQASRSMTAGEFENEPITIIVKEGTLTVGIKKEIECAKDWTIFDNVRLYYCGIDLSTMLEAHKNKWNTYKEITDQANDHSAFDKILEDADDYCKTKERIEEYDGRVWQAVCDLLKNGTPANDSGQFDITSLVENPSFDTDVNGWTTVHTPGNGNGVAEFYSKEGAASIAQTLPNMPAGTYTLKAQAFHRTGYYKYSTDDYEHGIDNVTASLFLNSSQTTIKNINDDGQTYYSPSRHDDDVAGAYMHTMPNSLASANSAFNNGLYWNVLDAQLESDDDIEIGLKITDGKPQNWVAFDNFRLYYDKSTPTIDLDTTSPLTEDIYANVTSNINLQTGQLNKVCLPFDLNQTQIGSIFSGVYTLAGIVEQDGSLTGTLIPAHEMKAGHCYFVEVSTTKTLAVDNVLVRAVPAVKENVIWEGAVVSGNYNGYTFSIEKPDGTPVTDLTLQKIDFSNDVNFTINQENLIVRKYLTETDYGQYEDNTPSVVSQYINKPRPRSDQPHSVFIPVPQKNADLTVTVSKNADYSEAETFSFDAGTTLCEVPNLIPQNTYYYKVEAAGSILTKGQFQTEGRIRMIKANTGFNIRDLGGWKTIDGNHLRYGKIFRGGELNFGHTLNSNDIAELKRLGIGAEVDLRDNADCNNTEPTESILEGEYLYVNQTYNENNYESDKEKYKKAFNFTLANLREGKAVYFHCRIGADRTGAYGLLLGGLCGMTFDQLCKDFELTSFSTAGTREWNVPGLNLLDKLGYINSLPGNTLQQKFFYYMNAEVGISANDLLDFIDIMVDGESSIKNQDLAFTNEEGQYLQSSDDIKAICAPGSNIVSGAKALLSDGTTTTDIDMSIDAITLSFGEMTLEAGKNYTLTIPAGAVEKDGVENASKVTLSFHTPYIFDGIYYLYSQSADGFLSAGNDYGTSACVDRYGLPLRWTVGIDGRGTLQYLPSQLYLYGPNWVYVNGEASEAIHFVVDASNVEGFEGYQLRDISHTTGQYLYTRLRTAANYATQYGRVAANGNLAVGGNCDSVEWTVWQFYTPAQQQAKLAADREAETLRAGAAAGIAAESVADFDQQLAERFTATPLTDVIATHASGGWTAGSTWNTQDDRITYLNVYNTGSYGGEIYEKNGYLEQTVNVPHPGLYRIDLHAFMRQARRAYCFNLGHQGIEPSTAYIEANGYRAQIPAWYSDCTEEKKPDNVTETQEFFAAGKYALSLYTYAADDCKLTLRIAAESLAQMQWCIFSDPTLTALVPAVTISENATKAPAACDYANVTLERTLQPGIWNNFSVPFDLTADQISNSALAGATFYAFKQSDAENITFQTVTAIEAGKPYLVRLADTQTENIVNPAFAGVSIVSAQGETQGEDGTVQFVGQIYNKPLTGIANVCYLSTATQKLKKLSATGSIKGLRCYFIVPGASTANVKLIFDTPTGIEEVESTNNEVHSTDVVYDLQGRRVATPAKGIYIVNGKKVYVK